MTLPTLFAIAIAMVSSLSLSRGHTPEADLSGKWRLSVSTPGGATAPTLQLEQQGTDLRGTYTVSTSDRTIPLSGLVRGDSVQFRFAPGATPGSDKIVYRARVVSEDSLRGHVTIGNSDIPFIGVRQR